MNCFLVSVYLLKAVRANTKEMPKAASTYNDGFLKAAGNFMKKTEKNCQYQ
jgi:hypothetical protein